MKSYFFRIADSILELAVKEECLCFVLPNTFEAFRIEGKEASGKQTGKIILCTEADTDREKQPDLPCIIQTEDFCVWDGEECFLMDYPSRDAVLSGRIDKNKEEATLFLNPDIRDAEGISAAVRDCFFCFLQRWNKTVIHSASIVYKGYVWAFSAPSGTGKSTHVEQWRNMKYPFSDLNGDLLICYLDSEGKMMAAGAPWCGTSNICCNETRPLGGIFFLKQAKQCRVEELTLSRGIVSMVARLLSPSWTREMVEKNVNLVTGFAGEFRMADLFCTPTREAAECVKTYIDLSNLSNTMLPETIDIC